MLNINSI